MESSTDARASARKAVPVPPMQRRTARAKAADIPPHSWRVSRWSQDAPHVFPNTTESARHVVRCHRDELIAAGALVRVGRELCVLGGPYAAWLTKKTKLVSDYTVPMNAPEHAAKRGGRNKETSRTATEIS